MIDTVIFDIGGVLSVLGRMNFFRKFDYTEQYRERLMMDTVLSPWWKEFDRAVMTEEEIIDRFVQGDPEAEKDIRHVMKNINGIVVRADYAIPWIRSLKERGLRVLYLSNYSEKVLRDCPEVTDFLPETDGGVFSYTCHLIKPEPGIYWELIGKYHLVPERCVFLDDLQANLDGAAAFGIHTIRFLSHGQAQEDLEALLKSENG